MSGHHFDPTILREYDVRGRLGETLSEDDARALGRGFGTIARRRGASRIAVGRDGRLSSPAMVAALTEGLTAAGVDVLNVGLGPTPMLYYATYERPVDGGIMVTGSHNPPDYNGFKMVLQRTTFFGEEIQKMGALVAQGDFESGAGSVASEDIREDYVARLLQDRPGGPAMKVAWDAGNGATGEVMAMLTAQLPGEHFLLNREIDGTFPSHHPDPTVPENLVQLCETVEAEGCDLGIAFDGDGDRIGAVDAHGRILWGDQIMLLLAREVLAQRPGSTIIADVKTSQVLFDEVARLGGKPLMWKTGHSLIKSKMAELSAPFAGEMSAHIFFADRYYGYDDALYAAVRMLGALANAGESLAAFRDSLPPAVNTPELRFPCSEERKWAVVTEVRDRMRAAGADLSDIDGVRVKTEDGWWLLRASNTQDVLVARCEAADEAGLGRLKAAVGAQLSESGLSLPDA